MQLEYADEMPPWDHDDCEHDRRSDHLEAKDLHEVGELDQPEAVEDHVGEVFVRQEHLVAAHEEAVHGAHRIEPEAGSDLRDRFGEAGEDRQRSEQEVEDDGNRIDGNHNERGVHTRERWHEQISHELANAEVAGNRTDGQAGDAEEDHTPVDAFDVFFRSDLNAREEHQPRKNDEAPVQSDAVEITGEHEDDEQNGEDGADLFVAAHLTELRIFFFEIADIREFVFWFEDLWQKPDEYQTEDQVWQILPEKFNPGCTVRFCAFRQSQVGSVPEQVHEVWRIDEHAGCASGETTNQHDDRRVDGNAELEAHAEPEGEGRHHNPGVTAGNGVENAANDKYAVQ